MRRLISSLGSAFLATFFVFSGVHAQTLSAGGAHTCAVSAEGHLLCWGSNEFGQLGNGNLLESLTPVPVEGLIGTVASVSTGASHTCAVMEYGAVFCWGLNAQGQLGDGTSELRPSPVAVQGLSEPVVQVSAGYTHTCALTQRGSVLCWGDAESVQSASTSAHSLPIPLPVVGLPSAVISISAGLESTCALTVVGNVFCWGENTYGQLGNRMTHQFAVAPTLVSGLSGQVVAISHHAYHACATLANGDAQCWGHNAFGQLGNATFNDQLRPTLVSSSETFLRVHTGRSQSCGITAGGSVTCWGDNGFGQLGDGSRITRPTSQMVNRLDVEVAQLSVGDFHACVLSTEGEISCWGWNGNGQVGDGTTLMALRPYQVPGQFRLTPASSAVPMLSRQTLGSFR